MASQLRLVWRMLAWSVSQIRRCSIAGRVVGKLELSILLLTGLVSCGLPNSLAIPAAPISVDNNSSDNTLVFVTPNDSSIDRYIIWYKIYPLRDRTTTDNLVNADYNYLKDSSVRSASDIRQRDFHELQLSSTIDDGYYLQGIGVGTSVTISKNPADQTNYITVSVAGGKSYNVRRDAPVSVIDNSRKVFYGKFNLLGDPDIRDRKNSDFANYETSGEGFAVAFLAQSAYIDVAELEIVRSVVSNLGVIYSSRGFENN